MEATERIEIRSMSNEPLTIRPHILADFSFSPKNLFSFEKDTNYTVHRLSTVMEPAIGTIMEIQFVFVSIPIDILSIACGWCLKSFRSIFHYLTLKFHQIYIALFRVAKPFP